MRDVSGWVRNRSDGCVEAVFEGDSEAVADCVAFCRSGPPQAQVDRIEVYEESPSDGARGFRITT
jgi:acylphosphatase